MIAFIPLVTPFQRPPPVRHLQVFRPVGTAIAPDGRFAPRNHFCLRRNFLGLPLALRFANGRSTSSIWKFDVTSHVALAVWPGGSDVSSQSRYDDEDTALEWAESEEEEEEDENDTGLEDGQEEPLSYLCSRLGLDEIEAEKVSRSLKYGSKHGPSITVSRLSAVLDLLLDKTGSPASLKSAVLARPALLKLDPKILRQTLRLYVQEPLGPAVRQGPSPQLPTSAVGSIAGGSGLVTDKQAPRLGRLGGGPKLNRDKEAPLWTTSSRTESCSGRGVAAPTPTPTPTPTSMWQKRLRKSLGAGLNLPLGHVSSVLSRRTKSVAQRAKAAAKVSKKRRKAQETSKPALLWVLGGPKVRTTTSTWPAQAEGPGRPRDSRDVKAERELAASVSVTHLTDLLLSKGFTTWEATVLLKEARDCSEDAEDAITEESLAETLRMLEVMGITGRFLHVLLSKYPDLLIQPPSLLLSKLQYLISLGLTPSTLARIMSKAPLLSLPEETLHRNYQTLLSLSLTPQDAASLIARSPAVLALQGTALSDLAALLTSHSITGAALKHVFLTAPPSMFSCSLETISRRLGQLSDAGFASPRAGSDSDSDLGPDADSDPGRGRRAPTPTPTQAAPDLVAVVTAFPRVLTLSHVNAVAPKLALLAQYGYGPAQVASYPPVLGCGLSTVLQPRLSFLRQLSPGSAETKTQLSLRDIFSPSDADFATGVAGVPAEEYDHFLQFQRFWGGQAAGDDGPTELPYEDIQDQLTWLSEPDDTL